MSYISLVGSKGSGRTWQERLLLRVDLRDCEGERGGLGASGSDPVPCPSPSSGSTSGSCPGSGEGDDVSSFISL